MLCPLCAAAIPAGETTCPGCGAELTDYLNAKYQPDLLFNEALQCMKRALELMMDLVELDSSEGRTEQLNLLVEEYDRDQADAGAVVKRELMEQNDRLQALLNRLERRLDQMENGLPSQGNRGNDAGSGPDQGGGRPKDLGNTPKDSGSMSGSAPDVTTGEDSGPESAQTPPASGQSPAPAGPGSGTGLPDDFFSGGLPDFSRFSGMFPPTEE